LKRFSLVDFLRDIGKHFRMGSMLGKESVRTRLGSEGGMSFAEFSYQLLQAYDFLKLYDSDRCLIQIGGSDQWGNITAGVELIRKIRRAEAYGLTIPLLCDSRGHKFGKTEENAVYLDARKTRYYDLYQFLLRTEDADVIRFLRALTFIPEREIAALETVLREAPDRRAAQQRLAQEVTRRVHGEQALATARRASSVLFGESMEGMQADDLLAVFADVPSAELPRAEVEGQPLPNVAAACGLCRTRGEARRLIESGGLYLNNRRVTGVGARIGAQDIIEGRLTVLRSGKKTFFLVKIR